MVDRRKDLAALFVEVGRPSLSTNPLVSGPMGLIAQALACLEWQWVGPFDVTLADGNNIDIRHVDISKWQHDIREGLRRREWQRADARRDNLRGVGGGINRDATVALLLSGRLGPQKEGLLRSIVADAIWTQERKFRAHLVEIPVCPHCSWGAVEDHAHMWWRCPAWAGIRSMYPRALRQNLYEMPACLANCGLAPAAWEDRKQVHTAEAEATPDTAGLSNDAGTGRRFDDVVVDLTCQDTGPYGETMSDGMVVVYTDGAAKGNQFRSARSAGIGGFWCRGHPFNFSEALAGDVQTNNRAELTAVLRVFQLELRPVEVRTDSAYVANCILKHMRLWKSTGWQSRGRVIKNADLWQQIEILLAARQPSSYKVTKIKGHVKDADVEAGAATREDKIGNDEADGLAVAGALRAFEPQRVETITTTMAVQRMMVEVCDARARAASQEASDSDSFSSDSSSHRSTSGSSSGNSGSSSNSSSSHHSGACRRLRRRTGRAAPDAPD